MYKISRMSCKQKYEFDPYHIFSTILSKINENGCKQINIDYPSYGWCRYAVISTMHLVLDFLSRENVRIPN